MADKTSGTKPLALMTYGDSIVETAWLEARTVGGEAAPRLSDRRPLARAPGEGATESVRGASPRPSSPRAQSLGAEAAHLMLLYGLAVIGSAALLDARFYEALLRRLRRLSATPPSNNSPTPHRSARHTWVNVFRVVFWPALSSRFSVGWLIPSRFAISVWVRLASLRIRRSASASCRAKSTPTTVTEGSIHMCIFRLYSGECRTVWPARRAACAGTTKTLARTQGGAQWRTVPRPRVAGLTHPSDVHPLGQLLRPSRLDPRRRPQPRVDSAIAP